MFGSNSSIFSIFWTILRGLNTHIDVGGARACRRWMAAPEAPRECRICNVLVECCGLCVYVFFFVCLFVCLLFQVEIVMESCTSRVDERIHRTSYELTQRYLAMHYSRSIVHIHVHAHMCIDIRADERFAYVHCVHARCCT